MFFLLSLSLSLGSNILETCSFRRSSTRPTFVTRNSLPWIQSTLSAAFGPRPELRGSPAVPILCVHSGFRGQEPLEDLYMALSGRIVERSSASGPARRQACEWSKRGRELPGLCPILSWRILGENTCEDPILRHKQNMNSARGQVSDELWGNFRVQHRQGCAALFLMILVVVGCHWTAFKRMAFGSLSSSCYFLPPIGQYSSPCLPMLKESFSLIRSPKTLHLVNPVNPCGFNSGQVKADDLSPHLMVSG